MKRLFLKTKVLHSTQLHEATAEEVLKYKNKKNLFF